MTDVARTIAVVAGKGGVGKTTTVINLSAALAETGRRCLVVDCDPQANLTFGLGYDTYESRPTVSDVVRREVAAAGAIVGTAHHGLDLLPASTDLVSLEASLSSSLGRELFLRQALEADRVFERYDYVLFDTPPSFGYHTIIALASSRFVVVPLQMSGFALHGLGEVVRTLSVARRALNPDLLLLGTVPTFVERRTCFSRDMLEGVRETASLRVFESHLTRSVRVQETSLLRVPVLTHAPSSAAAAQFRSLAAEVEQAVEACGPADAAAATEAAVPERAPAASSNGHAPQEPPTVFVGTPDAGRTAVARAAVPERSALEPIVQAPRVAVAVLDREPDPEPVVPSGEVPGTAVEPWPSTPRRPVDLRPYVTAPRRRGLAALFRLGRAR